MSVQLNELLQSGRSYLTSMQVKTELDRSSSSQPPIPLAFPEETPRLTCYTIDYFCLFFIFICMEAHCVRFIHAVVGSCSVITFMPV